MDNYPPTCILITMLAYLSTATMAAGYDLYFGAFFTKGGNTPEFILLFACVLAVMMLIWKMEDWTVRKFKMYILSIYTEYASYTISKDKCKKCMEGPVNINLKKRAEGLG